MHWQADETERWERRRPRRQLAVRDWSDWHDTIDSIDSIDTIDSIDSIDWNRLNRLQRLGLRGRVATAPQLWEREASASRVAMWARALRERFRLRKMFALFRAMSNTQREAEASRSQSG
jgi:hypothetical protein